MPQHLRQPAVESTPGHEFSYSLPSFPILLLFNKAGHCSGNLPVQLPGYSCRQTGKQNSCSQRAAECSVAKAEGKKKVESEKVSCSGTENQVGENHSPPEFMLQLEGSQSALQTRRAGSVLLSLEHNTLLEKKNGAG